MSRVKRGDIVKILVGKDKGKVGTILKVIKNKKIVIEGLNIAKKHKKGDPANNSPGSIMDKEMTIDISNVKEVVDDSK